MISDHKLVRLDFESLGFPFLRNILISLSRYFRAQEPDTDLAASMRNTRISWSKCKYDVLVSMILSLRSNFIVTHF